MESRKTDAPLSPDPTCPGALPAPGVHSRFTPSCFPLPVLAGFGRAGCHNSGLILAQNWRCRGLSAHCERDGAEQAAAHGTEAPVAADAQAGCRWLPCTSWQPRGQAAASAKAPGSGASLCKLGGALVVTLRAFQSGSLLGREVEQAAALLTPSFPALPVCSTADAGQEGRQPCVCCSGDRGRLCPPCTGRCRCPCGAAHSNCGCP